MNLKKLAPGRLGQATLLASLCALVWMLVGGLTATTTQAGYVDNAGATVKVTGSYDLNLTVKSPDGSVVQGEGNPDPLEVSADDVVLTIKTPVVWRLTIASTAAPGQVRLQLTDVLATPADPDLFAQLRFTVTDVATGTVLCNTATAASCSGVLLGTIGDTAKSFDVAVVLDESTTSRFDGVTAGFVMAAVGENS